MKNQFTRKEVLEIIEDLLQHPDILIDAVSNEDTDWYNENLLELVSD